MRTVRSTIARTRVACATALVAIACMTGARQGAAEDVSRGQSLYRQLGCNAASCHGANPALSLNNVLNGAGSPATIEYAATIRSDMNALLTYFGIDPSIALDLAAYLATVVPQPPAPPAAGVVEYFHAGFGHYFMTSIAAEIAALDAGTFAGWSRTGKTFNAYASGNGVVQPVCRFFTVAFAPKSSHFYTPVADECAGLRTASRDWRYEGEAFFVDGADASGGCAAGTRPVFRLYNGGRGGAPNHRYTTDAAVRAQMLGEGWVSEGLGAQGVIFCVPA